MTDAVWQTPAVVLITGIMAAGKSTVAENWPVADLDADLRTQTPRIGLWLDTSAQPPEETVDEILARAWTDGRVG